MSLGPKGRAKRPRDPNQLAKRVVDLATMDENELTELRKKVVAEKKRAKPPAPYKPGKRSS